MRPQGPEYLAPLPLSISGSIRLRLPRHKVGWTMKNTLVTVFGGSGFLGRYTVRTLARRGYRVRVAVRYPNLANYLLPMGHAGQIQILKTDATEPGQVTAALRGAALAVNLTGILYARGKQSFEAVHSGAAGLIGQSARDAGVDRLVHISALGADAASESDYARTKAEGEARIRATFPSATILRPSLLIGPEDAFFNRFAWLARFSPILPLIGGGKTRFQPAAVWDVAEAVARSLERLDTPGNTYELGGGRVYSFRALMELMLREIARKRVLLPVPYGFAMLKAFFLQFLPNPLLTPDQVRLLKTDSVVAAGARTFADLEIVPEDIESMVPHYLWRFRREGQFSPGAPDRFNPAASLQ
jgi:NADH dehydrogenase